MCMLYSTDRFNKQGDHIQPWLTPFPIWEQSVVLCPLLTVAFYPVMQASQKAGKLVWYSLVFKNFPQFPLIHTGKGFSRVKPVDLLIWSSAFSESSLYRLKCLVHILLKHSMKDFEHSLPSISLVKWVKLYDSLSIPWHYTSLRLEWKRTISNIVPTAKFSKFDGILSTALSQHLHLGFEIVSWNNITFPNFVHKDAS